jgi:hypothetical protein
MGVHTHTHLNRDQIGLAGLVSEVSLELVPELQIGACPDLSPALAPGCVHHLLTKGHVGRTLQAYLARVPQILRMKIRKLKQTIVFRGGIWPEGAETARKFGRDGRTLRDRCDLINANASSFLWIPNTPPKRGPLSRSLTRKTQLARCLGRSVWAITLGNLSRA